MGESGRGGNDKKKSRRFATGSSSRSPSPDCRTPRSGLACARYGTDSWPSEIPFNPGYHHKESHGP